MKTLAYRRELVAARRLAARSGLTPDDALARVLQAAAGDGALSALLDQRRTALAADEARRLARATGQAERRAAKLAARTAPAGSWEAWFDGSARPNPGRMGLGALLRSPAGEEERISRHAGQGDSSTAECLALIALLELALARGATPLLIQGDSDVVIGALQGRAPAASIAALCAQAQDLLTRHGAVTLRWVPRHRNGAADALAQAALAAPSTQASISPA